MTAKSEVSVEQLVQRLVEAEIAETAALDRQDMKAQNRWFDRSAAVITELLSKGEAGKAALEELLNHELPMVRMVAAASVLKWVPERALPVIEELVAWSHGHAAGHRSPVVSHISLGAGGLLALHYGIDINEVVPRVLGIEE
jgi:hypothetical protein